MPSNWGLTLALSGLVMFVLYRRGRRLFLRQRFSPPRLYFRLALMTAIAGVFIVVLGLANGLVPIAGLALGALAGGIGVVLARFESIEGELHFTPNRYLGLAVLSLFVGRMLFRLVTVVAIAPAAADAGDPAQVGSLENLSNSPTTGGVLLLLLGYYIAFSAGVLVRGRRISKQPATR